MMNGKITKICAAVLVALCAFGALAEASAPDLAGMTLEELIALRDEAHQEILRRISSQSGELIPGEYLVGRDIAAGSYTITCLKGERADESGVLASAIDRVGSLLGDDTQQKARQFVEGFSTEHMLLGVFAAGESYENGRNTISPDEAFVSYADTSYSLKEGESAVLDLKEGEYLLVRRGEGTCVPFSAVYAQNEE